MIRAMKFVLAAGAFALTGSAGLMAQAADSQGVIGHPATANESRNENMEQARDATLSKDQAAASIPGTTYQVIQFKAGSDTLTESAKEHLRSLVDSAKSHGKIDEAHIAVFADKPFPKDTNSDLDKPDRKLVSKRIAAIKDFMKKSLNFSSYKTYSMAEHSNWFARAFSTDDSELKSLFAKRGAPLNGDANQFEVVKEKGGPGKAVILMQMRDLAKTDSVARSPASRRNGSVSASTQSASDNRAGERKQHDKASH